MRVGHLQPTRPEWYDRNPAAIVAQPTFTQVGPTGTTNISSYTIPTGKKAYLDAVNADVFRTADATPNGRFFLGLLVNDGSATGWIITVDSSVSNYGPMGDQWIGQGGILSAGQSLTWQISSSFADGTVSGSGMTKVTTFDV